jgi:hypothetical protein
MDFIAVLPQKQPFCFDYGSKPYQTALALGECKLKLGKTSETTEDSENCDEPIAQIVQVCLEC